MKSWRPGGWKTIAHQKTDCTLADDVDEAIHNSFEAGADAEWEGVQDYIAELSKTCNDNKMFRVKLFLWLTGD